jgi:probable HAF family extracellular repeat protein
MTFSICFNAILFSAVLAVSTTAHAGARYTVRPIGDAGSVPAAINNNGQVVGTFNSGEDVHGFLYSGLQFVDLGTLGGASSRATDINDSGVIVGAADNGSGALRAFLYRDGGMQDIGTLGGTNSSASAINNRGQIAGVSDTEDGSFAFLYTPGMQNLGTLPGGIASRAEGINNVGTVVGGSFTGNIPPPIFHAFMLSAGSMIDLDTPMSPWSVGHAINDNGEVVGWTNAGLHIDHAFVYSEGEMRDLGTLTGSGSSIAYDINNAGQIVGWSEVPGKETRAILCIDDVMVDLNKWINSSLEWTVEAAYSINDKQQIAAYGCNGSVCQALLLDPIFDVPEPRASVLLLTGLGLIASTFRRKGSRSRQAKLG